MKQSRRTIIVMISIGKGLNILMDRKKRKRKNQIKVEIYLSCLNQEINPGFLQVITMGEIITSKTH